jgi:outer membrane protein TolC
MRRGSGAFSVLVALAAGYSAASAQDVPPPPQPAPGPAPQQPAPQQPTPAPPGDAKAPEVKILPEEELRRVRSELARIEGERKKLAGEQGDLELRAKELEKQAAGLPTSPVLHPRMEVLPITVRDTIRRALGNNPDYLVQKLTSDAAQMQPDVEQAVFDPVLNVQANWSTNNVPNLSNSEFTGLPVGLSDFRHDDWTFLSTLQEYFPTGTTVKATYADGHDINNNIFSVNPSYGPVRLRGDLTQNLLKGFWPNPIDVNLAKMRAAQDDAEAADALFASQLMDAVLAVESAYWDVVRAEENLKVAESSLRSANELLQDRKKRRELGAGTGLDITVAEAGVATRRENMIVAENDLETKRDALIRLTEPVSRPDRYDLYLVPVERPDETPAPEEEVETVLQTALARRPDYRRAQLQVDSASKALVAAENNALPSLQALAFIEEDGLGETSYESWKTLKTGHYYSAGGGIQLQLPLFLRAERAQAAQAKANLDRTDASLQALESDILLDVRRSVRNIRTARARIEATHTARILSVKQLEAIKKEVEFGVALPRQVLDSQTDLDTARSREIQALIDYRVAISTLEKSKGTILDAYSEQLPERVRRAFAH